MSNDPFNLRLLGWGLTNIFNRVKIQSVTLEERRDAPTPMPDDTISTVEAASILGGTRPWIYKLIKRGELEAERIGRDWRVSRASVEALALELKKKGRNPDVSTI